MGIKHKATKTPNEEGHASEWNDEHKIDSDVNYAGHSGVNLGEPISPSDIATKNYVDVQAGGITSAVRYVNSVHFSDSNMGTLWHDVPGSSITVTVSSGQIVLILIQGLADLDTADAALDVQIYRGGTGLGNQMAGIGNIGGTDSSIPFSLHAVDIPGSGSFTYKLRADSDEGTTDINDGLITVIVFN